MEINSKEYWDERFKNGLWDEWKGKEYSAYFATLAVDAFPEWFDHLLHVNNWTLFDYGCAEGGGTAVLSARYPLLRTVGIDFSENAIIHAKENYSHCEFICGDINAALKQADVVFTSNTLEHLKNPLMFLEHLVKSADRYAVILVPFEDKSEIEEHINVFNISSFPEQISDHSLVYFKVINCRSKENTKWIGKQLLLIYAYQPQDKFIPLNMAHIYDEYICPLMEENYANEVELQHKFERAVAEAQDQKRFFESIIANTNDALEQLRNDALDSLNRVKKISRSRPYRVAHLLVEIRYALFGKKEDRLLGQKYLFQDRKTITRHNYTDEIRQSLLHLGNAVDVHKQLDQYEDRESRVILHNIISQYEGQNIYVMPVLIDWNVPLFQRPQQIAMGIAHNGALFVYFTSNKYDNIIYPEIVEENLILVKQHSMGMVLELATQCKKHVIIDMYSTAFFYDLNWVKQWEKYNCTLLYEYVDEISSEIADSDIPESALHKHSFLLRDKNVFVVATAEKLFKEVVKARGTNNTMLSGNGVDVAHFQQPVNWALVPERLVKPIQSGCPVIGYFGAIAVWFDYDLIYEAAEKRPDYLFLMIGPQYGDPKKTKEQVMRLSEKDNIIFTGTIDYKVLPHIANNFTVATIPFLINEITESTSPIKLYEYMSMGKPIVTTAMRECMKHPEVKIAHNSEEYVTLLDQMVALVSSAEYEAYKEQLLTVAYQNSWDVKAREIIELIDKGTKTGTSHED